MKKITIAAFFLLTFCTVFAQHPVKQSKTQDRGTVVEIETTMGKIAVLLFDDTPEHRQNFLKLVNEHFYDGLLFHRVIKGFMIQGGDPDSRHAEPGALLGNGTLGYTIPAEFRPGHFHRKGALCAARQGDQVNPAKRSSPTQFYIVQGRTWNDEELHMMEQRYGKHFSEEAVKVYREIGGTPHLDGDYTVFGQVIDGMPIIDEIASVRTDKNDRPIEDVRIIGVKVREKK